MWHLHSHEGTIKAFNNLNELAKSIKTQSKQKLRLAPSEYGKFYSNKLFEKTKLISLKSVCLQTNQHRYFYVSRHIRSLQNNQLTSIAKMNYEKNVHNYSIQSKTSESIKVRLLHKSSIST